MRKLPSSNPDAGHCHVCGKSTKLNIHEHCGEKTGHCTKESKAREDRTKKYYKNDSLYRIWRDRGVI